ncbi:MAG: methyltransferase domain-containing protein [Aphanocapsa sp. GSE-SYN-MK-11-07L]|jgi:SAM-dependent methyltransferase|nr:methyltransferase domain-containing protein [Aphanocapsa sp. GSE-SYN-MK-11-07L]
MTISPTSDRPLAEVAEFFTDQWQLYRKILQANYMSHQQFYTALNCFFQDYAAPFQLLELGCGDASLTLQALQAAAITDYVGVDLSETALALAAQNFAHQSFSHQFYQGDFCQWLPTHTASYDLVLASFSVHHLSLAAKANLFGQIQAHLKPGGKFLLLDVMRRDQESRDDYMQRYLAHIQQDWTQMQPQEVAAINQHITEYDFPETLAELEDLAQINGFQTAECLYTDAAIAAKLLCFSS